MYSIVMPKTYGFKCADLNPTLRESIIGCKYKPKITEDREDREDREDALKREEFIPKTRNIINTVDTVAGGINIGGVNIGDTLG